MVFLSYLPGPRTDSEGVLFSIRHRLAPSRECCILERSEQTSLVPDRTALMDVFLARLVFVGQVLLAADRWRRIGRGTEGGRRPSSRAGRPFY